MLVTCLKSPKNLPAFFASPERSYMVSCPLGIAASCRLTLPSLRTLQSHWFSRWSFNTPTSSLPWCRGFGIKAFKKEGMANCVECYWEFEYAGWESCTNFEKMWVTRESDNSTFWWEWQPHCRGWKREKELRKRRSSLEAGEDVTGGNFF